MTNNARSTPPRRARRLIARRNRQLARLTDLQGAVIDAKHELSRREVAVLLIAREHGLRIRYGPGSWEIVG